MQQIKNAITTACQTLEAAEAMLTVVLRIFRKQDANYEMPLLSQVRETKEMLADMHGDLAEMMVANKQAWGICNAVEDALGDNLDHEVGSAASITILLNRHQAALVAAKAEGRKEALTQCEQMCEDVIARWQKVNTNYASGAKDGAFDCKFAIRTALQD